MFILGQTLHGLGSTPLFSIGTAYIDENVSQKASPMYLGNDSFSFYGYISAAAHDLGRFRIVFDSVLFQFRLGSG